MAPKPKKQGAPSRGQRSITMFFPGGAGGSPGGEAPRSPPAKRPRTERKQQQQPPPPPPDSTAGGSEPSPPPAAEPPRPVPPRAPLPASDPAQAREAMQQKLALVGERRGAVARAAQPIEPPQLTGGGGEAPKLTPLEQQIVALKRQHPGILLCVEVGYKMKMFGHDAEVASRELGVYAYQDRAFLCAGFPMLRLHVHVRRLVQAGHKVGVVRQVETAAIKKAGDNRAGPFERQLTALYTRATLEAGELGGMADDGEEDGDEEEPEAAAAAASAAAGGNEQQGGAPGSPSRAAAPPAAPPRRRWRQAAAQPAAPSSYLVCCVEEAVQDVGGAAVQAVDVGLVAVEPSTGSVLHAQFRDGLLRQELECKLLFAAPAELVLAEPASAETRRLLGAIGQQLGAAPRLEAVPGARYRQAGAALDAVLAFYGRRDSTPGGGTGGEPAPAAALEAVRALPPLVARALAHLLDYLRPFGLQSVLRLGASFQPWSGAQEMRLSANTLRQLEIFRNVDGSPKGSLVSVMDHTKTAFGRRLLHSWVGKPLRQRAAIEARLDAVQELAEAGGDHPVLCRLVSTLRKLPDLERGITRAFHATIRPSDLAALLHQFSQLQEQLGVGAGAAAPGTSGDTGGSCCEGAGPVAAASPQPAGGGSEAEGGASGAAAPPVALPGVRSQLLRQLLRAAADPSVAAAARQMLDCMDLQAAAANDKANVLKPSERFPEVLRWREEAAAAERALQGLLPQYRRALQISTLQFQTLQNQGEYLVEVPTDLVKRVPKDWQKVSSVKKGVRYHPPEVTAGLQRLALAREHLKAACDAAWRQFLLDFGSHYLGFRAAVQAAAALDCLCSLATLASSVGYCRPQLAGEGEAAQVHIEAGRHPVLELLLEGRGQQVVPNDTHLQEDGVRCQIITGPNMGGKSCYSRQCALIAIMAQVGSYVPAAAARLRPLDGVFTRMGASDCLALGRSTFAEELGETSAIVAGATPSSLVILDELGRGTSTGDGAAIAEATLRHLAQRVRPLTLFITHYPDVCFRLQQALPEAVACYRMAHVEEEGEQQQPEQQPEQQQQPEQPEQQVGQEQEQEQEQEQRQRRRRQAALGRVVFLFKLVPGVAPASFGINVARMAQLPDTVLQRAAEVAARVQDSAERRRRQQAAAAAGGGGGCGGGAAEEERAAQLARQCRQFLQLSLSAGRVDVEAGRQLQQQARALLAG